MAFRLPKSLPHLRSLSPRFLTTDPSIPALTDSSVLLQLSTLLPPTPTPPPPPPPPPPPAPPRTVASTLLSPADQLRGVFLLPRLSTAALHAALSATAVPPTPPVFTSLLSHAALSPANALSFFDWATAHPALLPPALPTYNSALLALGRRSFFHCWPHILSHMASRRLRPTPATVHILLDCLARARLVSRAIHTFQTLHEFGAQRNTETFNILLKCLCSRGHVGRANSLLNTMRGEIDFDAGTYNAVIGGWARFGRVDMVERWRGVMEEEGIAADELTYSHLIEALGRAGRVDDAVEVFEGMSERGNVCYNAMISNFIAVRDLDRAMGFCRMDCLPDVEVYDKLISALLRVRRVADALELFDEMIGRGVLPSTGMISSCIERLCSYGPPHAAMVIYEKSRKAGCRVSMKAYKFLLMRLSRFGKCGMVLKVWEQMRESGYASDKEVYEYIVNGLCNIGRVDTAVLVTEECLRSGFDIGRIVYSKLNNLLLEMDKVETAYKLKLKVKEARTGFNSQRFWRSNGWHF